MDVAASSPENGDIDVPVDALISIRFSRPALMQSLNAQTVTLTGPMGSICPSVFGAKIGMLAFLNPSHSLAPATTHAIHPRAILTPTTPMVPFSHFPHNSPPP